MQFLFGERVPAEWMTFLMGESSHPIFELELLPVLVSLITWRSKLAQCQCIFYLDNAAAKGALIHAATSTKSGQAILREFINEEMDIQIKVWFSRVPTASNIADSPSRLETEELNALGVERSTVDWKVLLERVGKIGSNQWGLDDGIRD